LISTERKKELLLFNFADSGKMVYIAVQIENGNMRGPWGPWGPMVFAMIP
jgi:hypothetical protein